MNAPAQAGLASLSLKDPKLFREQCFIGGEWVGGANTIPVRNPATQAVLGTVPKLGAEEARRAWSAPSFGTVPSTACVAGLRTGMVFAPPIHSPPM